MCCCCFRNNLSHQLQLAMARADSESLARSIAEETIADLEKEKTMKELELKEVISRHRTDIANKDSLIASVSWTSSNRLLLRVFKNSFFFQEETLFSQSAFLRF